MDINTAPHQYMSINDSFILDHQCTLLPPLTCYHYHNGCEIYLFLQGNTTLYVESNAFPLVRGDLFIFRPDELHRAFCQEDDIYERFTIHLQENFLKDLSSQQTNLTSCFFDRPLGVGNKRHLNEQELQDILLLLYKLGDSIHGNSYGDDILKSAIITELLVRINLLYQQKKESHSNYMPSLIKGVMSYIESHLTEEILLQDLSNHLFHNGTYISRKFKEATGITIRQYIVYKRVILAKKLLTNGVSLTDTCDLSGFHDYSNFNRTFTKQVGCPPGQFQKAAGTRINTPSIQEEENDY